MIVVIIIVKEIKYKNPKGFFFLLFDNTKYLFYNEIMKKINKKRKYFNINNIIKKRFYVYFVLIIFLFGIILYKSFDVMIVDNREYNEKLNKLNNKFVYGDSTPRGRILDRNGKIIVDNKARRIITYEKGKKVSKEEMVKLSKKVSKHLDLDYKKIKDIDKRKYYCIEKYDKCYKYIDKKSKDKYKHKKINYKELMDIMYKRVDDKLIKKMSKDELKSAYLYYLMNKGYSYDKKIIKVNAEDKEYAYIAENNESLKGFNTGEDWVRYYPYKEVFASILGSVSNNGLPLEKKDYYLKKGYSLNDRVGLSYLEKEYEEYLKGEKAYYEQIDSSTLSLIREGKRGNDIYLSIDIELQKKIEKFIDEEIKRTKEEANTKYYDHSTVIIEDPNTGEILAMASRKIKDGKIVDNTTSILTNPITPGSVVKGASILVGYNSGAIHIGSEMVDECIKVRGVEEKCSYHTLGLINDITALAQSSNVYQFKTAIRVNEQEYFPDMPLIFRQSSFDRYRKMYRSFGLGNSTGIDLPFESHGYTSKDKRAGNLLDYVIGQYETYTPLQLSQYISTIATSGKRYKLHLLKRVEDLDGNVIYKYDNEVLNEVKTQSKYMDRVREGFYAVCHAPGAYGVGYLDDRLDGSGKTGTSQSFIDTTGNGVIDTETITSSFVGYFPSKKPKYSITVTSPNSSLPSSDGYTSLVTYRLTGKISEYMYENYLK